LDQGLENKGWNEIRMDSAGERRAADWDQDKTCLLRRNTMRGRPNVTQRHPTEITTSSVDSPDCEASLTR